MFFIAFSVNAEVKPHMQNFYMLTNKIQNYIYDKSDYFNKKNEKEIAKALKEFNENTLKLKKDKLAQNDDMKFQLLQLSEGLADAEQAFKDGFKDYSYWILKSSFNHCFACHTQKGLSETNFKMLSNKKANTYAQAEFLFIIRNYTEANKILEKIVTEYPKNKATIEELESSVQKLLFHAVRVQKNELATIDLFERLLKNKNLPSSLRNDILAWKKYLNVKKYRIDEETDLDSASSIEEFIESRNHIAGSYKLSNQRYIVDLETTQKLYELLETSNDKNLRPWILYWLAYQEKDYRLTMFDVSSENYLKECIEKYSHHKAAKKCFAFYKEMQTELFTGSRGTDIPKAVSDQILKYDNMVNGK